MKNKNLMRAAVLSALLIGTAVPMMAMAQAPAVVPGQAPVVDPAAPAVAADTPATPATATDPAAPATADAAPAVPAIDLTAPFADSLFFSPAERVALRSAVVGKVTGTAALNAGSTINIPAKRVIMLSGVYYKSSTDWVVWINGQKMTPKSLLPEVMDVSVRDDKVSLKWFDIGLNDVISITLRPHQTYDIVTGVLLPG